MEMMDYIKEQCTVLRKMLAERAEDTAVFRKIFINERPDHIYLIASGTSRNAASVASYFMEDCLGIEVTKKQ